jgi:hypothetical protein
LPLNQRLVEEVKYRAFYSPLSVYILYDRSRPCRAAGCNIHEPECGGRGVSRIFYNRGKAPRNFPSAICNLFFLQIGYGDKGALDRDKRLPAKFIGSPRDFIGYPVVYGGANVNDEGQARVHEDRDRRSNSPIAYGTVVFAILLLSAIISGNKGANGLFDVDETAVAGFYLALGWRALGFGAAAALVICFGNVGLRIKGVSK